MSGNSFGQLFRLTSYGESHGAGLGGVIDGCPAGLSISEEEIQQELDRRRPGQGIASTARKESDTVHLLSGVFEGKTTGTAIGFHIANEDQRSRDYSTIQNVFRPGHADFGYDAKFGFRDYRGGGRSSGRETVSRVVGGAVAQAVLDQYGISVMAYTREIGGIEAELADLDGVQERPYFAACDDVIPLWEERIKEIMAQGDTLGGIVEIVVTGVPAGLGEPVFDKLDARLAYALMGVGAVKGVEIGSGFEAARSLGSMNNDPMTAEGFASNSAGGILGGISSGQSIVARVAIKPIPSIAQEQQTVTRDGEETTIRIGGRHDICAIPRVNPVLRAMTRLCLADMLLLQRRNISL
ncbi:chorismate synthase [Desulfobaculum bizertense]|uniref:Chorismate synthase n=1 Tax=Desulfobaculum bizertense DSM 18034 TaxID=1121442 RepID=A0A1T4WIZ1_9BACT|nr:chorismate synthase [Desulfobaculum bizertense]SKA77314.1 chorismate synthase [Desulfobaculum bizertense DSM 18034]